MIDLRIPIQQYQSKEERESGCPCVALIEREEDMFLPSGVTIRAMTRGQSFALIAAWSEVVVKVVLGQTYQPSPLHRHLLSLEEKKN